MTLKELRNTKGLTQAQCAAYLGMSTRSYQNYENNAEKTKKRDTTRSIRGWRLMGSPHLSLCQRKRWSFTRMS